MSLEDLTGNIQVQNHQCLSPDFGICDHPLGNAYMIKDQHPRIFAKLGPKFDLHVSTALPVAHFDSYARRCEKLYSFIVSAPSNQVRRKATTTSINARSIKAPTAKSALTGLKSSFARRLRKSYKSEGRVQTRTDLMGLLQSMGVELPSSTKLSEEDLEKKLATALTFSQGISSSSKFPLNPTKLSAWKVCRYHPASRLPL